MRRRAGASRRVPRQASCFSAFPLPVHTYSCPACPLVRLSACPLVRLSCSPAPFCADLSAPSYFRLSLFPPPCFTPHSGDPALPTSLGGHSASPAFSALSPRLRARLFVPRLSACLARSPFLRRAFSTLLFHPSLFPRPSFTPHSGGHALRISFPCPPPVRATPPLFRVRPFCAPLFHGAFCPPPCLHASGHAPRPARMADARNEAPDA